MKINPNSDAFLKRPTKCWLGRKVNPQPETNTPVVRSQDKRIV
jgi:hypothetical protein